MVELFSPPKVVAKSMKQVFTRDQFGDSQIRNCVTESCKVQVSGTHLKNKDGPLQHTSDLVNSRPPFSYISRSHGDLNFRSFKACKLVHLRQTKVT